MAEGIKVGDTASRGRILDLVYPVGTVYKSFNPKSPAEWLGGTWEKIEGRVLLGAGEEYPVGSVGGEAAHKITVREMPIHDHTQSAVTDDGNNNPVVNHIKAGSFSGATQPLSYGYKSSSQSNYVKTQPAGGDEPHNNMPPYISVYIWRRIV